MNDCYHVLLNNGATVYVSAPGFMYAGPLACKKYQEENPDDPNKHNVRVKDFLPPEQGRNNQDIVFVEG